MTEAKRTPVTSLYARHSAAADRGHWSVNSDVRWGDIDIQRAHRQPDVLRAVRSAARELSARSASVARMLPTAIRDVHACAVLTLDLYDGLKHFHALRTYLDTVEFTPALSDEELADVRDTANQAAPGFEDCPSALVTCLLTQHIASAHIRHLCARTEEPVLAGLLSLIAADETRQARIVSDLLALQIAADPEVGARVLRQAEQLRRDAKQNHGFQGWPRDDVATQAFMGHVDALSRTASRLATTPRVALSP